LFITAAIVKKKKKRERDCELGGEMFLIFIQKVLDSAILNRLKIQSPFLPQLKKKSFCSRQDEHLEWNTNILGKVQICTVEILTGITLAKGFAFINPAQL
jgi:hypothetical protein